MNTIDEILSQIPLGQLASQLGVDKQQVEQASRQALPALLGGIEANAQDDEGAKSLARALDKHADRPLGESLDVERIDTADGQKVVNHIFGQKSDEVVNRLGGASAGGDGLVNKLLPMLAPIVLSFLAKKLTGGAAAGSSAGAQGGMGGILGSILGGGKSTGGGGLADMLGGIVGGSGAGTASGTSDPLGGLLDGLLGGGRR